METNITAEIQRAAEERVLEFKRRLIRDVAALTCDVPKTEMQLHLLIAGLIPEERVKLTVVLWKELQQVVRAVVEAK